MPSYPPLRNPTTARSNINIFLNTSRMFIFLLSLVETKCSIITGKRSANELEQTAPIKLINNPKLGAKITIEKVNKT